jgi:hypothetical protein
VTKKAILSFEIHLAMGAKMVFQTKKRNTFPRTAEEARDGDWAPRIHQ